MKTAENIAKRIQSELTSRAFYLIGEKISISACFGISLVAPDIGLKDDQLANLIKRTELALKSAKNQGINQIVINNED